VVGDDGLEAAALQVSQHPVPSRLRKASRGAASTIDVDLDGLPTGAVRQGSAFALLVPQVWGQQSGPYIDPGPEDLCVLGSQLRRIHPVVRIPEVAVLVEGHDEIFPFVRRGRRLFWRFGAPLLLTAMPVDRPVGSAVTARTRLATLE